MKNKKGFTLVELLVVIAIIGILCIIIVASINRHRPFGFLQPDTAYACGFWSACPPTEQVQVQSNQDKMFNAVPLPTLKGSLERMNIKKRLEMWSNESQISYIYLISFGKVMAFYTVKGKVTSSEKRMTSNQTQQDSQYCGTGNCSLVVEAPGLDGTYGSSDPYVFFWTTDGAYVQWSGEYMLSDQPLKLATQPELTREVK